MAQQLAADHCSSCGREQYGYGDGYTSCCNKRLCSGSGLYHYLLVTDLETFVDAGTVRACCVAAANVAAEAQGVVVSHMLAA